MAEFEISPKLRKELEERAKIWSKRYIEALHDFFKEAEKEAEKHKVEVDKLLEERVRKIVFSKEFIDELSNVIALRLTKKLKEEVV